MAENEKTCYGIDLGTTYSCIARINPATNQPEIIKDYDTDQETLASAIYFAEDGVIYHGEEAKEAGVSGEKRLCEFFKRYIGRDDLAELDKDKIDGPHYMFEPIDGKTYTPIELSSMVLQKVVDYAKAAGNEVDDVVITVPAYFDHGQREATKRAGTNIGLNVINVVNEPTAAAMYYYMDKLHEDMTILVYDLGGGTFDISLVHIGVQDGQPTVDVIGTDGDDRLGGKDWDARLYNLLKKKFEEENGEEYAEDSDEAYDIRKKVERAKISLSLSSGVAKVVGEDVSGKVQVTREEFEAVTTDLVEKTVVLLDKVLQKAANNPEYKISEDQIDKVLMVGGSTKMPMIQKMLKDRFGEDRVIFNDPNTAVAKGAAVIAQTNYIENFEKGLKDYEIIIHEDPEGEDKKDKIEVIDPKTGEKDDAKSEELTNLISKGGVSISKNVTPDGKTTIGFAGTSKGIKFLDNTPRTFGLVLLGDDAVTYIADNVVKKGDKSPITVERTYYTVYDNQQTVFIPVVESLSMDKEFVVSQTGTTVEDLRITCSDLSIDMKQRNILVLDAGMPLPKGTPLYVVFSIANDGEIKISVEERISKTNKNINFTFTDY